MFADGQWARAKGYDTFAPIGPWIETELDPTNLEIQTYVDGEPRRHGNTKDLLHKIPELIAYISDVWTLLPGDIIMTGTPSGLGGFVDGQTHRHRHRRHRPADATRRATVTSGAPREVARVSRAAALSDDDIRIARRRSHIVLISGQALAGHRNGRDALGRRAAGDPGIRLGGAVGNGRDRHDSRCGDSLLCRSRHSPDVPAVRPHSRPAPSSPRPERGSDCSRPSS